MRFSEDFISRVRDANNVVDVISQYTQLKRSGAGLVGLCPFPNHREKTPSFSVSDSKQAYYCFGCKKGGNIITFLQEYQGLSFPEAIEYLAEKAGIPLPKEDNSAFKDDTREAKKLFYKLNRLAGSYFKTQLEEQPFNSPVKEYIRMRGLSDDIVRDFKLGYSSAEWSGLANLISEKKAPLVEAEKLGLVRKKQGGGYFDLFRDRLMFPILSPSGEVLGFGGRILGEGQPKYLNSPESLVFHKGQTLYGLHETAKYLRSDDEAIVVEGYMDFLALYAAGIKNVVATLGTALTLEHAKLIKRYTNRVLVLFDGDRAGQQASMRSLPILLEAGLLPRGLILPNTLDPDEALKELGVDAVRTYIKEARDLFSQELIKLIQDSNGQASDKVKIMDLVLPWLAKAADLKLKDLYLVELSERLGIDINIVKRGLKAFEAKAQGLSSPHTKTNSVPVSNKLTHDENLPLPQKKLTIKNPRKEEILLINLLLAKEEFMEMFLSQQDKDVIIQNLGQEFRELTQSLLELYAQSSNDYEKLTSILSTRIEDPSLLTRHLEPDFVEDLGVGGERLLKDCMNKIRDRSLRAKAKVLLNELSGSQDAAKLEQIMNIHRQRRSLKRDPNPKE